MAFNYVSDQPLNCNSTAIVLQDAAQVCSTYIDALQACSTSFVNQQDRFQIVNKTSLCLNAVFYSDGDSSQYTNPSYYYDIVGIGPTPVIPNNGSCKYPDFLPILENACAFDLGQVNYTCVDEGGTYAYYGIGVDPFIGCATEAMYQYWRCTKQESYNDVASCVEENAFKVDWLPQFQDYTGADSCPEPDTYLIKQAGSMLINIVHHILSTMFGAKLWQKIKKVAGFGKDKSANGEGHDQDEKDNSGSIPIESPTPKGPADITKQPVQVGQREFSDEPIPPKPWDTETNWSFSTSNILFSVGRELLNAYLTVLVLQKFGQVGTVSAAYFWFDAFLFFTIRPRIAPILGFLGFWKGFSQAGLADVFADWMISWTAGTFVLARYWSLVDNSPANPAAPVEALKILAIGALMSCIPAFAFLFIALLIGLLVSGTIWIGLIAIVMAVAMIIGLYMFLPILGAIELLTMGIIWLTSKIKKRPKRTEKSFWEQPLGAITNAFGKSFRIIYGAMVLSSFLINIGNWIFFASYLKLQGALFCPSDRDYITAIWFLVPVGVDMVYYAYTSLTGPQQM